MSTTTASPSSYADMSDQEDNFRKNRGDEQRKAFDSYVHALTVISEPHRLIHDGFMFTMSGIATAVANAGEVDILFDLPAGVVGHLHNVEYTMDDAPCTIEFFEDVTTSAAGNATNVVNHNRLSSNIIPGASVTEGPTITDIGTLLSTRYIPASGSAGQQPAGQIVAGQDFEWVMGNGVKYVWRITNNSGGAINIGYHFNAYEIGYVA